MVINKVREMLSENQIDINGILFEDGEIEKIISFFPSNVIRSSGVTTVCLCNETRIFGIGAVNVVFTCINGYISKISMMASDKESYDRLALALLNDGVPDFFRSSKGVIASWIDKRDYWVSLGPGKYEAEFRLAGMSGKDGIQKAG